MTERERLIGLLKNDNCPSPFICDSGCKYISSENCLAERMADHLLENGIITLPVRVGDTVYIKGEAVKISYIHIEEEVTYCIQLDCGERDCCCCHFYEDSVSWEGEHDCSRYGYIEFTVNDIGETVFLTREEAENVLSERGDT